jgi:hypothetical protein
MVLFTLITLGAILSTALFHAYANLRNIRDSWSEYRCNPAYMLFADDIGDNFRSCMNLIGKSVVGGMTDSLGSQFSLIGGMLKDMTNPLALFRSMTMTMRKFTMSFASSSLSKASGPVSMFVYYLNKLQDLIRRIAGEGYLATFFGLSAISFIEGFVSLILGVIKAFVIAMLIIAVILALFQPQILAIVLVIAASLRAAGV